MHIENTATPKESHTPQSRYASLHRAIEKGMASDKVWSELTRTCLALGFDDEAVRAYREVKSLQMIRSLEVRLAHHGVISGSVRQTRDEEMGPGSGHNETREYREETGFRDVLADSFQVLFLDHMPVTVIVATLTFPLVVGLGGFLTAGSHLLLLPAIALLPGLSVLGIVGALGRRIMVDAGQGLYDPPPVPDFRTLCREAPRFIWDMLVLCLVFLGPGTATLLLLPDNLLPALGLLFVGMFVMPMALLLTELSDDWRALSPRVLLRAIGRGGLEYARTSLVICALILPAILSALVTMGSHLYLQISIVGPLFVVPLFVSCRLLGNFFHSQQEQLQGLVGKDLPEDYPEEYPEEVEEQTDLEPELVEPSAMYHDPQPLRAPDRADLLDELPDLSNLPGARIVKSKDRKQEGAASRREA